VRPAEFWLAVITTLGVLMVGLLAGILVAVILSLIIVRQFDGHRRSMI
jgi:MFS superfamily sulfate permease-like transporter